MAWPRRRRDPAAAADERPADAAAPAPGDAVDRSPAAGGEPAATEGGGSAGGGRLGRSGGEEGVRPAGGGRLGRSGGEEGEQPVDAGRRAPSGGEEPDGRERRPPLRRRVAARLRTVDTDPRLVEAARRARWRLPGDERYGDPLSTAGDRPAHLLGQRVATLNGDRPSALRELGLGAIQVWQALSEAQGRGHGDAEVAILFTDVVGFSDWALEAGDGRAVELLRRVAEAVETPVAAHGGTLVKRMGDGHMAVFPVGPVDGAASRGAAGSGAAGGGGAGSGAAGSGAAGSGAAGGRGAGSGAAGGGAAGSGATGGGAARSGGASRGATGGGAAGSGAVAVAGGLADAVAAAREAVAAVAAIELAGHRPALRAGLHVGTPRRLGGDWFGVDVNVAARVGAAAGPGEVLISSEARARLGASVATGPRRRLDAKGAPDDLEVFAVSG